MSSAPSQNHRSPRILIVAAGWNDESPGGANRIPTDFARFLSHRGYSVAYLCMGDDHAHNPEMRDGVEIWRYQPPRAKSPSIRNLWAHLSHSRDLAGRIHARAPVSIVHGHSELQYLGVLRALAPEVRACYTCHSPFVAELKAHSQSASFAKSLAFALAARLEASIYRQSHVIHCCSEYSQSLLRRDYAAVTTDKIVVIPGWADTTRFTPAPDRREVRSRLGPPWNTDQTIFFTLRRLVRRMGVDTLLDATSMLAKERPFRLIVGGSGPDADALARRAAELGLSQRVSFLGKVPEANLADTYRAADCFVLPTRSLECFGLIVIESYASGVPVIGVPVGAIPEILNGEFAAWIAADNSATALAAKIREYLSGQLRADCASLRNRALQFSLEKRARQLQSLIFEGSQPVSAESDAACR